MLQEDLITRHLQSFCAFHPNQNLLLVCTSSSCQNRLICLECKIKHNQSHKNEIVPIKELLSDRAFSLIDLKINNLLKEDNHRQEVLTLLDHMDQSLETLLANMKKLLFNIHRVIGKYKSKIESQESNQKHTSQDWIRFKEFFRLKRESFLNSNAGQASPELEAFAVQYASIISKLDEDFNVSEEEAGICVSKFDTNSWERLLSKTTREIEEYYNNRLLQIFPKGPKGKIEKRMELGKKFNIDNQSVLSKTKTPKKNSQDCSSFPTWTETQINNQNSDVKVSSIIYSQQSKFIPTISSFELDTAPNANKSLRFPTFSRIDLNLKDRSERTEPTFREYFSGDNLSSQRSYEITSKGLERSNLQQDSQLFFSQIQDAQNNGMSFSRKTTNPGYPNVSTKHKNFV